MSRGKYWRFIFIGLLSYAALAGCASTQTAAPVDDRTAVRTENIPDAPRADNARGSQSGGNSTKSGANPNGATQSSNKDASSQTQSNNQSAQTETGSDKASQSSSTKSNGGTQSAAQQPAQSAKDTAPRRNPRVASKPYREGDWRPEFHTVRKGDTLYSIALDFGQDYRDLARWNALADPSYIQIGQKLRLFPDGDSGAGAESLSGAEQIPTFSDPKAYRAIYTEQAYAELTRVLSGETETVVVKSVPATTAAGKQPVKRPVQATKPASTGAPETTQAAMPDGRMSWEWPAPGKVRYKFATGPNKKGVAIEGKPGQAVVSSAPGKVVYSGSGLRGYGNLIIIKHNETYLSVYAHNSQLLVREGQMVAQGQKIAVMGKALGSTTALHFEIRRLGKPIDPLSQLPARPS